MTDNSQAGAAEPSTSQREWPILVRAHDGNGDKSQKLKFSTIVSSTSSSPIQYAGCPADKVSHSPFAGPASRPRNLLTHLHRPAAASSHIPPTKEEEGSQEAVQRKQGRLLHLLRRGERHRAVLLAPAPARRAQTGQRRAETAAAQAATERACAEAAG